MIVGRWCVLGLALGAGLAPVTAPAADFLFEGTASRSMAGLSVLVDLPLVEDRTYATLCYGLSKPLPVPGTTPLPPTHQFCAGVDYSWGGHWMISGIASVSPRSVVHEVLIPDRFNFTSANSSAGTTISFAYNTGGFSDWEWSADATVGFTAYAAPHTWTLRNPDTGEQTVWTPRIGTGVLVGRPSVGLNLTWKLDLDLSLRGSYYLYSADPLEVGRIRDEEITALVGKVREYLDASGRTALAESFAEYFQNTLGGRALQADAISGLMSAPVWFELRPTIAYRFNDLVRGQIAYAFARYVPTQGKSHILSTKWTFHFNDTLRIWGALAVQRDEPEGVSPSVSGLLTLGTEVSF